MSDEEGLKCEGLWCDGDDDGKAVRVFVNRLTIEGNPVLLDLGPICLAEWKRRVAELAAKELI